MSAEFSSTLLVPAARLIVVGSMAWGIFKVLRDQEALEGVAVGCVVGLLGITFFQSYFDILRTMSETLESFVRNSGDGESIFRVLKQSVENVKLPMNPDTPEGARIASEAYGSAIFGAIIQGTVWGTLRLVIEFFFVILSGTLETISLALLQLVKIFFPVAAALYAARPQVLTNLAAYAVELSLWSPVLTIVRAVSGYVSKGYISGEFEHQGMPLGLSMIVVQLASIFLFLKIPGFVHSFVSGHLSGDHGLASPFSLVNTTIAVVAPKVAMAQKLGKAAMGRGKGKAAALLLCLGLGLSGQARAETGRIVLYPGFLTKVECQGRLLISAVGNEQMVERSALPADVGCGLYLKPLTNGGRTNLFLETTTGTVKRTLEIARIGTAQPKGADQVSVGSEP
jgi:hypothetical protein